MPEPDDLASLILSLTDQLEQAQQRHPVVRRGPRQPISDAVRLAVKMRDGFACVWCSSPHELQLDHIVPWSAGGSDRSENLRTLCAFCNDTRSNRRYVGDTGPRLPVTGACSRCEEVADDEWTNLRQAFCLTCRSRGRAREEDLW